MKTAKEFAKFLISMKPEIDEMAVIADIRPSDRLVGYYPEPDPEKKAAWDYFSLLLPRAVLHPEPEPLEFKPYDTPDNTFDRFKEVFPNVTEAWNKHIVPE